MIGDPSAQLQGIKIVRWKKRLVFSKKRSPTNARRIHRARVLRLLIRGGPREHQRSITRGAFAVWSAGALWRDRDRGRRPAVANLNDAGCRRIFRRTRRDETLASDRRRQF